MEKESLKYYYSNPIMLQVEPLHIIQARQQRLNLQAQYEYNLKAKFPSWMNEATCLKVIEMERKESKKSFINKLFRWKKK